MTVDGADTITLVDEIIDYMEGLDDIFPTPKMNGVGEHLHRFGRMVALKARLSGAIHLEPEEYAAVIADTILSHFTSVEIPGDRPGTTTTAAALIYEYMDLLLELTSSDPARARVLSLLSSNHALRTAIRAGARYDCH